MHISSALRVLLTVVSFLCALSACRKDDSHQASNSDTLESTVSQAAPEDKLATQQATASPGADPELEEALRIAEQMRRDAAQPANSALGLPAANPGVVDGPNPSENLDLQPIVGRDILAYQPAVQADLDAGKFSSLLEKHESACKESDRIAFFSLFTQSVRYGFSKMPKPQLEQYYRNACEGVWLASLKEASRNSRLRIIEDGSTEDGKKISTLCAVSDGQSCGVNFDVGIENGTLMWAEW